MNDAGLPQYAKAPSGGSADHAVTSAGASPHPSDVLLGTQAGKVVLPVCDHYSGTPQRMRKSLDLQAQMIQEFGACVFDVTLDCEDGAPVGAEADHAEAIVDLLIEAHKVQGLPCKRRVGVRVHQLGHAAFRADLDIILKQAGQCLAYVMVPKVESLRDVERAVAALDEERAFDMPLHVLIESPTAVRHVFEIAAHPRVESISFGLMDFVSAHGGAIGAEAMGSAGQFSHPLVLRAKTEISAACHAFGKVPSHCVVTEFTDTAALQQAALQAHRQLGYTRMWSIHPAQIRPIIAAFAPSGAELDAACAIIDAGARADWAPSSYLGQLHDRASYRYYWQVLQRAHATGSTLPSGIHAYFH
jgi:citrate lyase subunit beta / citryl-CoA lyase